jgi:signal transduction histidine kinase
VLDFLRRLFGPRSRSPRTPHDLEVEIEQRRRAEKELARKNRQLIEAERVKRDFFANLSHELRTPLTLILAPLESLLSGEFGPIGPTQRTGLQTVHNNAVRLLQMVTGVLDVTRLEATSVTVKREPVRLAALTRALFDDFQPLFRQGDLTGELDTRATEGAVLLDRYLYERIFFNLVSNAIKFTPAGGRVFIRVSVTAGRLRLAVRDTGIGISSSDLPMLFQKFRQLETSSTRRFEGSGLGLTLVKEFAGLLDGTVSVASTLGEGSEFVVECPAPPASTSDATDRPVLPKLVQRHTPPPPTRGATPLVTPAVILDSRSGEDSVPGDPFPTLPLVLVAEDNTELAAYICTLLRGSYQTVTARDGEEAIDQIRSSVPDLVLADVMMPKCDGLALCRAVKGNPATSGIPVILLTALTHRDALLRGWEAGADEYLFKPFHPRELLTRLQSLLSAARERRLGEARLRRANAELEERVRQRTAELAQLNCSLVAEVAQRRRLEQELRLRVEQLAEGDRRKDEFLAMLAHELRNPLAPVRNALHVLKLAPTDSTDFARVRAMMERQVDHLVLLVDDLLDVSRITRGVIELRKRPVLLADVLTQAVETTGPLLSARRHELRVVIPPEAVQLEGDPTRLAQVVSNLLNNAAKYTDPGGLIELSASVENEHAVIRIRDSGIGIPAEMLGRVFDLFVQLNRTIDRSQGGLGIGLTLVRRLVELHGGTVEAHSEGLGKGSEFVVRLPILKELPPALQVNGIGAARGVSTGRRVLVVDDNIDAAQTLALLLRVSGHVVRMAHDGPSGLAAAQEWLPEFVLLDIGLPGIDGYEVARRLRGEAESSKITLIAVSGYGQDEDRRRSAEAGFDEHLVKPVEPTALQRLLAGGGMAS